MNRLTDKKLKALTVGGHDREYTLSDGGGLMIRVSKNGVISWFYQYKLEGRISKVSRPRLGWTDPTWGLLGRASHGIVTQPHCSGAPT
ncbi:Arm DNA-binding domain-containing protein [Serratia sp. L9]|uniref:Arm DNA-binding domain-containing protein n=1 Tax=Serratia sp. L9 TaxID=3423946 RepID=UPI003D672229